MIRPGQTQSATPLTFLAAATVLSLTSMLAPAATPFNEATVTRLQNKVSYGTNTQAESARPAVVQDVVQAQNYLLSETDARAELKYPDGSIVRIGQNTIFSFEAESRTLTLKKGTFIFYVPKGLGNTTIKTPSLTAAITGTVGKVSENIIAILQGSVELQPSKKIVNAGQFARMNPGGDITVDFFDATKAMDGQLMGFNGPLPPYREAVATTNPLPPINVDAIEMLERATNHPSSQQEFFTTPSPKKNNDDGKKDAATPTPPPTPKPTPITPRPTREPNPNPTGSPGPTGTGTPNPTP